ncbi:hypothetical protein ON010_g8257 [Phytophthora cinnamomi]|nr:hypothetical protein ON010_g8257 [Phytophthora cinnamomi]
MATPETSRNRLNELGGQTHSKSQVETQRRQGAHNSSDHHAVRPEDTIASKGLVFGDIQLKGGGTSPYYNNTYRGDADLLIKQFLLLFRTTGGHDTRSGGSAGRGGHPPDQLGRTSRRPDYNARRAAAQAPRTGTPGWLVVCVFSYTDSGAAPSSEAAALAAVKGSWVLPPSSKAGATDKYTNMVVLDGFNACKYYFSSSGGANCLRGAQCHFWHGRPEDFKENRRRWMAKRLEQRAKAAHLAGDNGDPHSKIDKAQRSRIFCDWLVESLGVDRLADGTGVIDVAGGKGDIPIQLWIQRGIPTTLIDPRPMKLGKYNRKLVAKAEAVEGRKMSTQLLRCLDDETLNLHTELFADCSVLVGMHPDEATEAIVDAALTLGKPFAIVPCCVMSRVFPDRRCRDGTPVDTYETFVRYLLEKHPSVRSAFLPFAGRNQVLYLFDYDAENEQALK